MTGARFLRENGVTGECFVREDVVYVLPLAIGEWALANF